MTRAEGERWVIASSNAGKLAEFRDLLGDGGPACVPQAELGVVDAEETGLTFIENALIKARHAARATGLPALADDSGLCVDALDGAPGLYSARYAGGHGDAAANIAKLLAALKARPDAGRRARFVAVIAWLRHPLDPQPVVAQGVWHGCILERPRGAGGFGYDPVFQPDGHDCSAAELPPALKNRLGHRGQALLALRRQLLDLA
ncbi:RdgB/HAM1 family non-canonical purine NTP pyrophosphatase [Marilutibacter aestuarii]|uniref:dITP/XTP pyrophosphatase n=1 Tax=Marilutibacter aestuarii TaxID=1706195 RepID=A0A508ACC0_9GAMM|nr:RdgB/HAM1 family non-canonical purine NTP pyrophosphatase [Lysobacter aestuarii]TQD47047.1 RdgB/HAM1 family non-canonical purine NTP pyrophosphatase [Lysobacter aestuarii]